MTFESETMKLNYNSFCVIYTKYSESIKSKVSHLSLHLFKTCFQFFQSGNSTFAFAFNESLWQLIVDDLWENRKLKVNDFLMKIEVK